MKTWKKRWKVVFTLKNGERRRYNTHYFDEMYELQEIVEHGPDWGVLGFITITYQLGGKDD